MVTGQAGKVNKFYIMEKEIIIFSILLEKRSKTRKLWGFSLLELGTQTNKNMSKCKLLDISTGQNKIKKLFRYVYI